MLKKLILFLAFLLVVIYIAAGYYFSNMLLQPKGTGYEAAQRRTIARVGFDYEKVTKRLGERQDISIEGVDEATIKGWYYKQDSAQCAIVFAHGWGVNRTGSLKYAGLFEDCDCDMVFYDHRAHNESTGDYGTGGILESKDLQIMTDWLQQQNGLSDQQTAWVGVSWGAATVLQAGGESERKLAFILADSPFQSWLTATHERADVWFGKWTRIFTPILKLLVRIRAGVSFDDASPISHVANIKAPLFLIHSEGDKATGSQQSVNISKHLPQASVFHHTQWGSDHTQDITSHTSKYKALVDQFRARFTAGWSECDAEIIGAASNADDDRVDVD